jgi:digeranylgeranylglycerophospholipid reductase
MVSPLTAGGIHTALEHGRAAGEAIAAFRKGLRPDPQQWFVSSYPRFRLKRMLRWLFDHFQSDLAFNLLLGAAPMRAAARVVFFQRKRKRLSL